MARRLGCATLFSLLLLAAGVASASNVINVWIPWGGERFSQLQEAVSVFEEAHPDVEVVLSPSMGFDRFQIAQASGAAPDVMFIDGPQITSAAHLGMVLPIDAYLTRDNLSESDFFYGAFAQSLYRGQVWALPGQTNPMLGFFWNRSLFAEAGLPDAAPETVAQLDEYNRRLMKQTNEGEITRFGLVPWQVYGYANSLFNWGWIFGGRFYDPEHEVFTVDDPDIVHALEWWREYVDRYGFNNLQSLFATTTHALFTGAVAMAQLIPTLGIEQIKLLNHDPNDYGITPHQPYPEGGVENMAWAGGWTLAIPTGAPNPDLSWEFIRWYAADPVGTAVVYEKTGGDLSAYRYSPVFEEMASDPIQATFVRILELATYYRPATIVTDRMMAELDQAAIDVLQGIKTPVDTLRDVNSTLQAALEEALSR